MSSAPLVVEVKQLAKRFGERAALQGLDLELRAGECLGLLGPNGAGKSTLVRILATLLRPSAGAVRVLGLDPIADGDALRGRIGVVPQDIALYDQLSARENLAFFAGLFGLEHAARAAAVERGLELAGLAERADDRVQTFSGGMKRRLNVAVALVHDPELVFLDEPTVGVDPQSRQRIFEVVERLAQAGTAMIYTSHQLGEVERLCDRIVILDRGQKIAEGTLAELQRRPEVERRGSAVLCFASTSAAERARVSLAERGIAAELEEEVPDLERIFLDLTGRALRDEVRE